MVRIADINNVPNRRHQYAQKELNQIAIPNKNDTAIAHTTASPCDFTRSSILSFRASQSIVTMEELNIAKRDAFNNGTS